MNFRLRDFVGHPLEILRFRRFLESSQWWSRERLEAWGLARLRRIVAHALANVPYYGRVARERGFRAEHVRSFEDLALFPILDRDDVVRHHDALVARNARRFEPLPGETSGSTGTPMRFLLDRHTNVLEFASLWRVLSWAGYRFGDRFVSMSGRLLPSGRLWQYDWRLNCLHVSTFDLRRENTREVADRIARFRPRLVKGYPSSISLLARWIVEDGIPAHRPHAVLCGSETLLDHQRATIERAFRCAVHDFYGQNERAALVSTCPRGTRHVHLEYSHVEVLDARGVPAVEGDAGEVVTTGFHNLAMPLIRYRTRDLAVRAAGACRCTRVHTPIERIVGRIEDVVVTPDGRHVGRLDAALKHARGILVSQVVQTTRDAITVRIVRTPEWTPAEEPGLVRHLRDRLGSAIAIGFEYVDRIEPGPNGKIKFVVSKVAPSGSS